MAKQKNYLFMVILAVAFIGIAMVFIEQCVLDRGFSLEKPFKFTIDTNIDMPEDQDEVTILVYVTSPNNDYPLLKIYDLDCNGDGEFELKEVNKPYYCKFKRNTGKYQIWVRGTFPQIILCPDGADNWKAVVSVDDWGEANWMCMDRFANNCQNLERIPQKAPDLSRVEHLSWMFANAHKFNQPLNHWDVSNIKYMSSMFSEAISFDQPLDKWDVSNVTDMSSMFSGATSFNQSLDNWNVSNVTNMNEMFKDAKSFGDYPENWVIPRLSRDMFTGTTLELVSKIYPLKRKEGPIRRGAPRKKEKK